MWIIKYYLKLCEKEISMKEAISEKLFLKIIDNVNTGEKK